MKMLRLFTLGILAWLAFTADRVHAWHHGGLAIGINFGPPVCYRPWGGYYYPYGYPYYVSPGPVLVQPAPIVVQPAPVVQTVPAAQPVQRLASAEPAPVLTPVSHHRQADVDQNLQLLADPNEQTRVGAVLELGKMKAVGAVEPVAKVLAEDRSPTVRETAARALGLIGSPRGLTALKYAAQADSDRDVRHSAAFAVEIIQSNMRR